MMYLATTERLHYVRRRTFHCQFRTSLQDVSALGRREEMEVGRAAIEKWPGIGAAWPAHFAGQGGGERWSFVFVLFSGIMKPPSLAQLDVQPSPTAQGWIHTLSVWKQQYDTKYI